MVESFDADENEVFGCDVELRSCLFYFFDSILFLMLNYIKNLVGKFIDI